MRANAPWRNARIAFGRMVLRKQFLTYEESRALHATHGVFLCPTRQGAQGVSMCEAMRSGLVTVTSASTAIPEFVTHGQSGFLTRDARELAAPLLTLQRDVGLFHRMSRAASESICRKAEFGPVVEQEVEYLLAAAG